MPVQQSLGVFKDEGNRRRWIMMQYETLSSPDPEEAYRFIPNRGSGCEFNLDWDTFAKMMQDEGKTDLLEKARVVMEKATLIQQRSHRANLSNRQLLTQLKRVLGEI